MSFFLQIPMPYCPFGPIQRPIGRLIILEMAHRQPCVSTRSPPWGLHLSGRRLLICSSTRRTQVRINNNQFRPKP
jgi:hypothetical protein